MLDWSTFELYLHAGRHEVYVHEHSVANICGTLPSIDMFNQRRSDGPERHKHYMRSKAT